MARIVNDQLREAKRNDILDAAERLVVTKGYEAMSIQDLLDAVGMSKGAFYHYFESKPELLVALVERRTALVEERLRAIVEDPALSGRDKLLRHFASVEDWKLTEGRVVTRLVRAWFADENAIVRQKLFAAGVARFTPLLERIIAQGVREGDFDAPDPAEAARMVLCLRQDLGRAAGEALLAGANNDDAIARMTAATADGIERLLGATPGSIAALSLAALAKWRAAAAAKRP